MDDIDFYIRYTGEVIEIQVKKDGLKVCYVSLIDLALCINMLDGYAKIIEDLDSESVGQEGIEFKMNCPCERGIERIILKIWVDGSELSKELFDKVIRAVFRLM